jgi:hypothetical protein
MAETLTATVTIKEVSNLVGDASELSTISSKLNDTQTITFANGTAANQANQRFDDTRSVNASSTDSLDLAGGLTNAFGTTLTFTSIKYIRISAASTNGDNLEVGGNANAFGTIFGDDTDKIIIPPGGHFVLSNPAATGFVVTASTGDVLDIANADSGAAASYDIVIIGEV